MLSTVLSLFALCPLVLSCPGHLAARNVDPSALIRRTTPEPSSKTAITNVRVFDGLCFTPPRTVIVDTTGLITKDDCNITTTIDATGQFLIPGLIDSHIHIMTMDGLENATSYGVTTTMNMACYSVPVCRGLKNHSGLADFRTSGNPAVGFNSTHYNSQIRQGSTPHAVNDDSNAFDLASWAVHNGSDYYKITLETNGPSYNLTRRLVGAVHALGQQTMSHASDWHSYAQAIDTGIDGIQHTPDDGNLTQAMIKQMKHNKQFVTPTLTIHAFSLNPVNPAILTVLRGTTNPGNSSWHNILHNARAMYKAGIPFLAGTDATGPIGGNLTIPWGSTMHGELRMLVEDVGMKPAEAINAATKLAAKYHRLSDRGVIKPGKRADLLLLKADPLVDIRNTESIVAVWIGGRKYNGPIGKF